MVLAYDDQSAATAVNKYNVYFAATALCQQFQSSSDNLKVCNKRDTKFECSHSHILCAFVCTV